MDSTNLGFLKDNKGKHLRLHTGKGIYTGVLAPTASSLVWTLETDDAYVVIKFLHSDITDWDITCQDLIPDVYLQKE